MKKTSKELLKELKKELNNIDLDIAQYLGLIEENGVNWKFENYDRIYNKLRSINKRLISFDFDCIDDTYEMIHTMWKYRDYLEWFLYCNGLNASEKSFEYLNELENRLLNNDNFKMYQLTHKTYNI